MSTFTASNDVKVGTSDTDWLSVYPNSNTKLIHLNTDEVAALREFFRAEEDERLGRWRDPEHPEFVAYWDRTLQHLTVIFEPGGGSTVFHRGDDLTHAGTPGEVARAYFDAHPEPNPWHKAKPGEIWSLTVEGVERTYAAILTRGLREPYVRMFPIDDVNAVSPGSSAPVITAGRRIYPEDDS